MSVKTRRSFAFVTPRFGRDIAGGAETLVASLARQLVRRGDHVEIFTTCAKNNTSWSNDFPAGRCDEDGLVVRRFEIDERDTDVWIEHQIAISEGLRLSLEAQLDWMQNGVNSTALYTALEVEADRFEAIFLAPYLFGTTFFGALVRPDKSILIPCLHDEHYAYLEIVESMFRQVKGALFNAAPEQELAERLYGHVAGGPVGMGFEGYSDEHLQGIKPYFKDNFPYLLYLGRKETGKGVQTLLDYFLELKANCEEASPLKLVICGGGDFANLHRPEALGNPDIIDLHQITEAEKRSLVRHAACLVQPSVNESFSIVIMEAWLLNVPVLVNAACAVTRTHVLDSGGGLYFDSSEDFARVVMELVQNQSMREKLALAGKSYVEREYNWEAVLKRFDEVLAGLTPKVPGGIIC